MELEVASSGDRLVDFKGIYKPFDRESRINNDRKNKESGLRYEYDYQGLGVNHKMVSVDITDKDVRTYAVVKEGYKIYIINQESVSALGIFLTEYLGYSAMDKSRKVDLKVAKI